MRKIIIFVTSTLGIIIFVPRRRAAEFRRKPAGNLLGKNNFSGVAGLAFRHGNFQLDSELFRAAVRRRWVPAANFLNDFPDGAAMVRFHQKNNEQVTRAAEIRVQVDENQAGKSRTGIFAVWQKPARTGNRFKTIRAGKIKKPALVIDALNVRAKAYEFRNKVIVAAVDVVNVANLSFAFCDETG